MDMADPAPGPAQAAELDFALEDMVGLLQRRAASPHPAGNPRRWPAAA
jgi:hypothetical protein